MNQAIPRIVEASNEFAADVAKAVRSKPLTPDDYEKLYDALGQQSRDLIKDTIITGHFAPNAPSTIRRKGPGKRPLMDTTDMHAAVTFSVREKVAT
jgi:hypothetical protein